MYFGFLGQVKARAIGWWFGGFGGHVLWSLMGGLGEVWVCVWRMGRDVVVWSWVGGWGSGELGRGIFGMGWC